MYLEFLFIFIDYFSVSKKRVLLFEWLFPIVAGISVFIMSYCYGKEEPFHIIEKSVSYLGTLLGFTLAALTLLLSSDKMTEARQYQLDRKIRGHNASLYEFIVVSYSYLIIIESILCICFFIADLFSFIYVELPAAILNSLFITFVFNVLFVTIRTITDLYFILVRK